MQSGGDVLTWTRWNGFDNFLELAEVISEINAIIRPQAKAKNQTFDIRTTPMKYEQVLSDKLRINQILINLLSNSVKYTPEGGRIEFRVEELPQAAKTFSRIRFTVSDNGMGMSEEYLTPATPSATGRRLWINLKLPSPVITI